MKNYKLDEKRFLESSIIANMQGLLSADWFTAHEPNYEQLALFSKNLALEQLKQRNDLFGVSEKIVKEKNIISASSVDFEEIISIFNSICFELPTVTKLTPGRENAILKILEMYSTQDIGDVFKNTAQSDYLIGKKVQWEADFDWIFTPKNFIKILEGKYKNIENGQITKQPKQYVASSELKEKIARRLFPEELS